jgi:hypothetical protein
MSEEKKFDYEESGLFFRYGSEKFRAKYEELSQPHGMLLNDHIKLRHFERAKKRDMTRTCWDFPCEPDRNELISRIDKFINIKNWNNVIIAGGFVIDVLLGINIGRNYHWSDIDLFLYGLNSIEDYNNKLIELSEDIIKKIPSATNTRVCKRIGFTKYSLLFWRDKYIQIILSNSPDPSCVINSFDLDISKCFYQNGEFFMTEECIRALKCNILIVNEEKMSVYSESRIKKYFYKKGFYVLSPIHINLKRIPRNTLERGQGLGGLLHNKDEERNFYQKFLGLCRENEMDCLDLHAMRLNNEILKQAGINIDSDLDKILTDDKSMFTIMSNCLGFKRDLGHLKNKQREIMTCIQKNNWCCLKRPKSYRCDLECCDLDYKDEILYNVLNQKYRGRSGIVITLLGKINEFTGYVNYCNIPEKLYMNIKNDCLLGVDEAIRSKKITTYHITKAFLMACERQNLNICLFILEFCKNLQVKSNITVKPNFNVDVFSIIQTFDKFMPTFSRYSSEDGMLFDYSFFKVIAYNKKVFMYNKSFYWTCISTLKRFITDHHIFLEPLLMLAEPNMMLSLHGVIIREGICTRTFSESYRGLIRKSKIDPLPFLNHTSPRHAIRELFQIIRKNRDYGYELFAKTRI